MIILSYCRAGYSAVLTRDFSSMEDAEEWVHNNGVLVLDVQECNVTNYRKVKS